MVASKGTFLTSNFKGLHPGGHFPGPLVVVFLALENWTMMGRPAPTRAPEARERRREMTHLFWRGFRAKIPKCYQQQV